MSHIIRVDEAIIASSVDARLDLFNGHGDVGGNIKCVAHSVPDHTASTCPHHSQVDSASDENAEE